MKTLISKIVGGRALAALMASHTSAAAKPKPNWTKSSANPQPSGPNSIWSLALT